MVQADSARPISERPLYQCRHTYAKLFFPRGGLNLLYVAHRMAHFTVAMVVQYYARWTRKPDRSDAERVERSLAAAGLLSPKMPGICGKVMDSTSPARHHNWAEVSDFA
jgi:hypothetical protein